MNGQCFFNEVEASFNLRQVKVNKPTNIYLVCRIQGKQVKLSTGVKVYPEHWNKKKQEAYVSFRLSELDNHNNTIANNKINELKSCFSKYKEYICCNPDKIKDSLDILRKYIYKDNMKKITKLQVNATITMQQIVEEQDIASSSKYTKSLAIKKFGKFLKDNAINNTWDNMNYETLNKYQDFLISEANTHNTIKNNLECLISIFKIANRNTNIPFKWSDSNLDSFEIIKNRANKTKLKDKQEPLTEEEVKLIYNYVPKGFNANKYIEIRDIFVLQCLVGQRISDMAKFFNKEYTVNETTNTISIIQQKTGAMAIIPLLPLVKEILDKYKNGLVYNKIQTTTKSSINRIIKVIAKNVGLTRTVNYQEQRGKNIINLSKPLYEMIHSHTARHTFITIMCRMGIPKDTVIIATGHEDTKMIDEAYEHLNEKDKAKQISNAFNKLDGEMFNMGINKPKTTVSESIISKISSNVSVFVNPEKYQQLFYDIDIFSYLFERNKYVKEVLFNNEIYSISHIKYYLETKTGKKDRDILTKKISDFVSSIKNIKNDTEIEFVRNRAKELGINDSFYKAEEILL